MKSSVIAFVISGIITLLFGVLVMFKGFNFYPNYFLSHFEVGIIFILIGFVNLLILFVLYAREERGKMEQSARLTPKKKS